MSDIFRPTAEFPEVFQFRTIEGFETNLPREFTKSPETRNALADFGHSLGILQFWLSDAGRSFRQRRDRTGESIEAIFKYNKSLVKLCETLGSAVRIIDSGIIQFHSDGSVKEFVIFLGGERKFILRKPNYLESFWKFKEDILKKEEKGDLSKYGVLKKVDRLVGLSLSGCLESMADGDVDPDDVDKVITGTKFSDLDQVLRYYGLSEDQISKKIEMPRKEQEKLRRRAELLRRLFSEGKIEQPRLNFGDGVKLPNVSAWPCWVAHEDDLMVRDDLINYGEICEYTRAPIIPMAAETEAKVLSPIFRSEIFERRPALLEACQEQAEKIESEIKEHRLLIVRVAARTGSTTTINRLEAQLLTKGVEVVRTTAEIQEVLERDLGRVNRVGGSDKERIIIIEETVNILGRRGKITDEKEQVRSRLFALLSKAEEKNLRFVFLAHDGYFDGRFGADAVSDDLLESFSGHNKEDFGMVSLETMNNQALEKLFEILSGEFPLPDCLKARKKQILDLCTTPQHLVWVVEHYCRAYEKKQDDEDAWIKAKNLDDFEMVSLISLVENGGAPLAKILKMVAEKGLLPLSDLDEQDRKFYERYKPFNFFEEVDSLIKIHGTILSDYIKDRLNQIS